MELTYDDLRTLVRAKAILDHPGLAAKISHVIGRPVEAGLQTLPATVQHFVFGATRVPFPTYLAATIVGMVPRTFAAVFAASQLEQLAFKNIEHRAVRYAGIAITIAVMVWVGVIANRAIKRMTPPPPEVV